MRHGELLYLFLITGSEHEDVISEGSGEPALLCNLVRVTLLTNSKFLSGWRLRPKQSRHLRTPTNKLCFKYANINFIRVWRVSKFTKTLRNKRNKISINWQKPSAASSSCADPEGEGQGVRTSLENYKNIRFLSNTGPDPLKNHSYQSSVQCWAII